MQLFALYLCAKNKSPASRTVVIMASPTRSRRLHDLPEVQRLLAVVARLFEHQQREDDPEAVEAEEEAVEMERVRVDRGPAVHGRRAEVDPASAGGKKHQKLVWKVESVAGTGFMGLAIRSKGGARRRQARAGCRRAGRS